MRAIESLERCLQAVDEFEQDVRAFAFLDRDRARAEALAVDERSTGALSGLCLGVKDIFETADQPTGYGSAIYDGFRPRADAAVVAQLRSAGAVCVGKTETTEFAMANPGRTRNPHRHDHTPGGSSMGSAAGIALSMFDIALGTQTAGSVIRPASFCGVFGFKPTKGTVSTAGVKPVAQSLDTVGWFARDVTLLDRVRVVLTARFPMAERTDAPSLGVLETDQWPQMSADSRDALGRAIDVAQGSGARVSELDHAGVLDGLTERHRLLNTYEAARSLAWEYREHRELLSKSAIQTIELGQQVDPADRDAVLADVAHALASEEKIFADAEFLIAPAAVGEAPFGHESTGDPRFCALWTLLGNPTISVPGLVGATGLPVGIQIIGRIGADASVLSAGKWLGEQLAREG